MLRLIEGNGIDKIQIANGVTINKELSKDIAYHKWIDMLISEHSTLEMSDFFIEMEVDGRAISHLVRHTKGHPRHSVQSQREDWTKTERPTPETKRQYFSKWSPISWMSMCRQRLCFKASNYTRDIIVKAKQKMIESESIYFQGLGFASVPECVYRKSCPYPPLSNTCKFFDKHEDYFTKHTIRGRYVEYNDIFNRSL